MAIILAVALLLLMTGRPAGAHVCASPAEVDVDESATVTVGVGAEATAVDTVEVGLPDGFRATAAGGRGWEAELDGRTVRYTGGSISPYTCELLSIEGVAEEEGALVFPLTVHREDGSTTTHDRPEPYYEDSALMVYADTEIPEPSFLEEEDRGLDTVSVVLIGAGAVLVAVLGGWMVRQRRAGAEADDPVDDPPGGEPEPEPEAPSEDGRPADG